MCPCAKRTVRAGGKTAAPPTLARATGTGAGTGPQVRAGGGEAEGGGGGVWEGLWRLGVVGLGEQKVLLDPVATGFYPPHRVQPVPSESCLPPLRLLLPHACCSVQ